MCIVTAVSERKQCWALRESEIAEKKHLRVQPVNIVGASASFFVSVCQFARPRETARLSVDKLSVVFYIEDFYYI